MNYTINEQLLNAIISYLASKPYIEVYSLINGIKSVIKEDKEEKDEKKTNVIEFKQKE